MKSTVSGPVAIAVIVVVIALVVGVGYWFMNRSSGPTRPAGSTPAAPTKGNQATPAPTNT